VKIRFFGNNLAIAYGSESRVKTSKDGKDSIETLIWTDTWLKRNGRWQIIAGRRSHPSRIARAASRASAYEEDPEVAAVVEGLFDQLMAGSDRVDLHGSPVKRRAQRGRADQPSG
jgi:hypothetical protein